jgi:hypothetical protein
MRLLLLGLALFGGSAFAQTSALLTWTPPTRFVDGSALNPATDLSGFGIYRDGERVGTAQGGVTTSYVDPIGFGTFEYCVTAIRTAAGTGAGLESDCSDSVSVTKVDGRVPERPSGLRAILEEIIAFLRRAFRSFPWV